MKVEIAHDALARQIYSLVSTEDKMLLKIHSFIQSRHSFFKENKVLLQKDDINYIRPYLKKINLTKDEKNFLIRSLTAYHMKRFFVVLGGVFTFILLALFGIYSFYIFRKLELSKQQLEHKLQILKTSQTERIKAEEKAKQILNGSYKLSEEDLKDTLVLRQLVIKYDTLVQVQAQNEKDRNIAQSATLSELAESALNQKNYKYALQLVEKALNLNPNNTQALQVLADLSQSNLTDFSEKNLDQLISKARKRIKTGKLKDKDFNAIFNKDNKVVQKRKDGVQDVVQQTVSNPNQQSSVQEQVVEPIILKEFKLLSGEDDKPVINQMQQMQQQNIIREDEYIGFLPCGLVNKLSDEWTLLGKNVEAAVAFRFVSQNALEVQMQLPDRLRRDQFRNVFLILDNGQKVVFKLSANSYSRQFKIIELPLTNSKKQKISKHKVLEIGITDSDTHIHLLKIPVENQAKLLRAAECYLK